MVRASPTVDDTTPMEAGLLIDALSFHTVADATPFTVIPPMIDVNAKG
jgi:hypothetical protein